MHEIAPARHRALVALCVGVGQGLALALERPPLRDNAREIFWPNGCVMESG